MAANDGGAVKIATEKIGKKTGVQPRKEFNVRLHARAGIIQRGGSAGPPEV